MRRILLGLALLLIVAAVIGDEDGFVPASSCPAQVKEWNDSPVASQLWQQMHDGSIDALKDFITREPCAVHIRSRDGRGPLFWAFEFQRREAIQYLLSRGADPMARDRDGKLPKDMVNLDTLNAHFKPAQGVKVLQENYVNAEEERQKAERLRVQKEVEEEERKRREEEEEMMRAAKERLASPSNVQDEL